MSSRWFRFGLFVAFAAWLAAPLLIGAQEKSKFDTYVEKLEKSTGLWDSWSNDERMLVEIKSSHIGKDFIIVTSISQGVGIGDVIGGMSWGFGDDAIWTFRKVGEKIHVVQRNVRFRAKAGSPEADAVSTAYSDSVLYALPILTTTPGGGSLVDMSRIFMSDDQGIGRQLGGARFQRDRSVFTKVKSYPENVEIRVNAVYQGGGSFDTIANPMGIQVGVHYSLRELPNTGYRPRAADDRVGYFLTVIKDFSDRSDDEHFVRYINRWNLEKADSKIELSPPKKPIVFYMEKTIPIELRPTVRAGIEEWNTAFRKIGFDNAIEVRQQQKEDSWDPEDIRYNTFRWITSDAGFAMGPSRVNPKTGEILDADIIFDAGFLDSWKRRYETFSDDVAIGLLPALPGSSVAHKHNSGHQCRICQGMGHQLGFAAAAVTMRSGVNAMSTELPKELVHQGLKEVVMHEVGHTLGLRHNFKASSWKPVGEITDVKYDGPTVASVMDYTPANVVAKKDQQGLYYTQKLGPYDEWAITYGYSHFEKSKETDELAKIAARSTEPGLVFATDEDTYMNNPDPFTNVWDLGSNPLDYVERQTDLIKELLPGVVARTLEDGDAFARARQAFGLLTSEYFRAALFASRFPGGVTVTRDHFNKEEYEKIGKTPFKVVSAEDQRRAMKLINENVFNVSAPEAKVLNALAPTNWNHWGSYSSSSRGDYDVHEQFNRMQTMVLARILNSDTLGRLIDNELKAEAPYTLAEHIQTVTDGLFGDIITIEADAKEPFKIDSFRRNLQRDALRRYAEIIGGSTRSSGLLVLIGGGSSAPDDAKSLVRMHLTRLQRTLAKRLKSDGEIDDTTRAHLLDMQTSIKQLLDAKLSVSGIN